MEKFVHISLLNCPYIYFETTALICLSVSLLDATGNCQAGPPIFHPSESCFRGHVVETCGGGISSS